MKHKDKGKKMQSAGIGLYIELFVAFCAGIGSLATICGAVYFTIKLSLDPFKVEMESLKKELNNLKEDRDKEDLGMKTWLKSVEGKLDNALEEMHNLYVTEKHCEEKRANCLGKLSTIKTTSTQHIPIMQP